MLHAHQFILLELLVVCSILYFGCYGLAKDNDYMNLDDKKEHILRCTTLGMALYKAQIISECTQAEIADLKNDKDFVLAVEQSYACAEYNLLQQHNTALKLAMRKGNATPIQWRLSKLNSERYGNTQSNGDEPPTEMTRPIIVKLTGADETK